MKEYLHKNEGTVTAVVYDLKRNRHVILPGMEVWIPERKEGGSIMIISERELEIEEEKKTKKKLITGGD